MPKTIRMCLLLTLAVGCLSVVAAAQTLFVGDLSYDQPTPGTTDQFDITNLVSEGLAVNSSGGAVTSTIPFGITVTSLTVDLASGSSIVLPGSDFTTLADGDVDCNASACNLYGDDITKAILTGTFTGASGLKGLDPGYTGIDTAYTATITPGCGTTYLEAGCDTALIDATETRAVSTPEPGIWVLLGVSMLGLLIARKRLRNPNPNSAAVA